MTEHKEVIRSERIWLKPTATLSKLCYLSKNLFNEANYFVRQEFFKNTGWLRYKELLNLLSDSENFQGLPLPTARKILYNVDLTWKSFFKALNDWKVNPEKYLQRPRIPKYKRKNGQYLLPFTNYQINFTNRKITLLPIPSVHVKTRLSSDTTLVGARIIPKGIGYILEIPYVKRIFTVLKKKPLRIVGLDIGLTNLITIVNNIGKKPIVVKGGVVKSINQYYNKERARLQSIYDKQLIKSGKKGLRLSDKRNRKIYHYFHEVSRFVIHWCQENRIDTIIIGCNKNWKQHANLGKRINQNFVFLPFHRLIQMIQYKAEEVGIRVIITREDYTSKCSFLDNEQILRHSKYVGDRITRGLFQASTGKILNSDVNGGYNIVKKAVPNAFSQWETVDGIEGVWLHPVRWKAIGEPVV